MSYNLSLDEIIKLNKLKTSHKPKNGRKPVFVRAGKISKNSFPRNVKKMSTSSFKSKPRRNRLPDVRDARLKILQNKKRLNSKNKSPLLVGKVMDARLKIEAHKHKKKVKPFPRKHDFDITEVASDGIIKRRISTTRGDSGVFVEYEDDEMNLETETLQKIDWSDPTLKIKRTVHNFQEKRIPARSDERTFFDNSRLGSPLYYNENEDDSIPYKEVTRTISNLKKGSLSTSRKSYRKSPPSRQYDSYEHEREISHSRLSPLAHPSPLSRESSYHRIMISNLHENVTGEDIKELFEDVGDLVYTKMIRTGMAEVAYKSQKDAMKAVEIYHNRQLDGLPMKCAFMSSNSDSSNSKKRSSGYVPPVSTFQSIEPDTRIIKKALFSD